MIYGQLFSALEMFWIGWGLLGTFMAFYGVKMGPPNIIEHLL